MDDKARKALDRAIEAAGGTQTALAAAIGFTKQAVGQWDRGISIPSLYAVVEMQEKFGIKGEHLRPQDERLFKQLRRAK